MKMIVLPTVMAAAAALLLAPSTGSAQITLGIKGGANLSDISDLEAELSESGNTDFVGGLYGNIGKRWSLQGELLYSIRSVDLAEQGTALGAFKQNFVEIPVLVHFRPLGGLIEPALYAGASVSFEADCNVEPAVGTSEECTGELVTDTKSSLWAGIVGAAVDLDIGLFILGLDGRYNFGFTSIAETSDAKWRYFSLMVQAAFNLGR